MVTGPPPGYRQKQRYDFNLATEMKAGSYTWLASPSDGFTVEYSVKPEASNKDGKEVEIVLGANCNPKEGSQDYNANVRMGGFGNDKAQSWSSLDFRANSDMDFGAGFSENIVYKHDGK